MKRFCMIAVLFLLAWAAKPAKAVSCSTYSTQVVFGNYSGGEIDVTATVTVQCDTAGTAFQIGLSQGTTPGASITNRLMYGGTGGQNTLGYGLYSNASHTTNWGNSSGTGWVTGTITAANTAQNYTVYAKLPASEVSPTGSYTDMVSISVTGSTFTTATGSFSVTSTVAPSCSITANALSFGAYTGSAAINVNTTISVTCGNGSAYNVGLNAGSTSGATVTTRQMLNGSKTLNYSLYSNSGRTTNWGNTVGTDTVAGTGSGSAQTITVYGQIPSGQKPAPGNYSDTVIATLTY